MDNTGTFQKLPVDIEAKPITEPMVVETDEGDYEVTQAMVDEGYWLITGVEGEKYPCSDSVFRETYMPVDEQAHDYW
jgi:hypothetical protein